MIASGGVQPAGGFSKCGRTRDMPLSEREKEELAKKIEQQREDMWKGQATSERGTRKKRWRKKTEEILESQHERREVEQAPEYPQELEEIEQAPEYPQKREEAEQIPEPHHHVIADEPVEERREVEQPPEEQSETEELAEKIRQQRRTVWQGKPEVKGRKKKKPRTTRSVRRVVPHQQESESSEKSPADERKAKEKSRDHKSKVPTLKLALIVVIGLIGAIAIGIAIGYVVAIKDLIKI